MHDIAESSKKFGFGPQTNQKTKKKIFSATRNVIEFGKFDKNKYSDQSREINAPSGSGYPGSILSTYKLLLIKIKISHYKIVNLTINEGFQMWKLYN